MLSMVCSGSHILQFNHPGNCPPVPPQYLGLESVLLVAEGVYVNTWNSFKESKYLSLQAKLGYSFCHHILEHRVFFGRCCKKLTGRPFMNVHAKPDCGLSYVYPRKSKCFHKTVRQDSFQKNLFFKFYPWAMPIVT